jgi:hypothetical protein
MTQGSDPIHIAGTKQLFLDRLLIESSKGITLALNYPYLPDENILPQDKPWEQVRAGLYNSILEHNGAYHMWYCSYGLGEDGANKQASSARFDCYAVSTDGIHWEKPNLGLVEYEGSKANNIVRVFSFGQVVIDPFDTPARRFKSVQYQAPRPYAGWPQTTQVKGAAIYLGYSPDGLRWSMEPEPFLPFYVGAPTSTIWDERLQKWILYIRVNPKGHPTDPWQSHLAFARLVVDKGDLAKPYPYRADPEKKRNQFGSFGGPTYEFPVVMEADDTDPDHQVYTMNAVRYPDTDVYIAFPGFWYPRTSDKDDVQFAFSRDGIAWQRPFRQAIIRLGMPGSGRQGYVCATEGIIRRGDEIWVYYQGLPERHLSPNVNLESINARAIFRLDGFISADADYTGGELLTPPVVFSGKYLQLNLDTSAGGTAMVELQDGSRTPIPGFTLEDADRLNGNSVRMQATWGARADIGFLSGKPIRIRFVMKNARLYAFQFV